jgi:tRNA(Arg) A34 adenosine deaminase TadA
VSEYHERFAREAIELARQARAAGNHPFGALLVIDSEVVLTAQNTVFTDRDPTAHAETNLVSRAIRELSPDRIRRSVLYTSCEPCAMCVGKMYWAGYDRWSIRSPPSNWRSWPAAVSWCPVGSYSREQPTPLG